MTVAVETIGFESLRFELRQAARANTLATRGEGILLGGKLAVLHRPKTVACTRRLWCRVDEIHSIRELRAGYVNGVGRLGEPRSVLHHPPDVIEVLFLPIEHVLHVRVAGQLYADGNHSEQRRDDRSGK